jgi:hypothetical protein
MIAASIDPEFWDYGMHVFALGAVSPWLPRPVRPRPDRRRDVDATQLKLLGFGVSAAHDARIEMVFPELSRHRGPRDGGCQRRRVCARAMNCSPS